ncbi:F-box protein PP2-B10-like [Spinacia oleracea]|uniref:F-box protein PP2-B10-like n=1 Tax=Spinacia oleracea TaxID=3562 RepID=A0ABM3R0Y9_SPIOL|nr:F-box protein PP2-B10-like [Spinacia oleracea]
MDGLPVECIATIISLTNPRDACCFASISRTFNSAANSDLVWDRFLPSDYRNILAQFDGGDHHQSLLDSSTSKKHLYMNLVDTPLLIDGGMMIFWVEKSTGKKCYTISAMKLHIHCSSRYNCRVESNYVPKSRFSEVVRVMNVQRINELGERIRTSMLSPNTKYTVYFVFRVENYSWNPRFQDPLRVKVEKFSPYEIKAVRGKVYVDRPDPKRAAMLKKNVVTCYSYLDKMGAEEEEEDSVKLPEKRRDGWMEVEMGEVIINEEEEEEEENYVLFSISTNPIYSRNESHLVVQGIEIRPTNRRCNQSKSSVGQRWLCDTNLLLSYMLDKIGNFF